MKLPTDCVCFHLRKAARAASRAYDEVLAPAGLRNTQFSILGIVHDREPVTMTELADLALVERTTLTRNLALLERERLVASHPGDDRRTRVVTLTGAGRAKLEVAMPLWRKAQKRMVKGLGTARKERLLRDLEFASQLGD